MKMPLSITSCPLQGELTPGEMAKTCLTTRSLITVGFVITGKAGMPVGVTRTWIWGVLLRHHS